MKVNKLLQVMDKLQAILEHYQENTVEEMLDDIYSRCCVAQGETRVPAVDHKTKLSAGNGSMEEAAPAIASSQDLLLINKDELPPPEQFIQLLFEIPEEELPGILDRYLKENLYTMVKMLNIKGHSQSKKSELITALVERAREPVPAMGKKTKTSQVLFDDSHGKSETALPQETGQEPSGKKPALLEAARIIPEMEKEEAMAFLAKYTRSDLLKIADILNLSVSRMATKNNMILMIANHFSYIKLHQQMSQRRK